MLIYVDKIRPRDYYLNTETLLNRLHFFDGLDVPHTITRDLNEYISSTDTVKVAALYNRFFNSSKDSTFIKKKFDTIKQASTVVLIIQTELHLSIIADYLSNNNVVGVLPGMFNPPLDFVNRQIIFKSTWISSQVDLYKQRPNVLDTLTPYETKPFYFDALIGSPRSNRLFVYNSIMDSTFREKFIVTTKDKFVIEPGTTLPPNVKHGHGSIPVTYLGVDTQLGFVMPIELYNQSCYSIVAETAYSNDFTFFTEKSLKPLIAKRLFVTFSGQHNLRNLRSLGFQTFGSVIDESYDNEPDQTKRYQMAWQQVQWLCNQPQEQILAQIKPILEHNHTNIMSRDWENPAITRIQNKIKRIALTNN